MKKLVMSKPDVSIIIPLYNSSHIFPLLYKKLVRVLQTLPFQTEIIFVDDKSSDTTVSIAFALMRKNPCAKLYQMEKNMGQHHALLTGFHHANGHTVVCLDDDLQTPPEEIPTLLHALQTTSADAVFGSYEKDEVTFSAFRFIGSILANLLMVIFIHKPIAIRATSFFAVKKSLVETINSQYPSTVFLPSLIFLYGKHIQSIPVAHKNRAHGTSQYSIKKLIDLFLFGIYCPRWLYVLRYGHPPSLPKHTNII